MEETKIPSQLEDLALRADAAAALLRTLANRHRIMILCELTIRERSVSELAAILNLGQSALSQHLARLRQERLVLTRRVASQVFYRVGDESVRDIMTVLYHVYCRKVEAIAAEHGMMRDPMGARGSSMMAPPPGMASPMPAMTMPAMTIAEPRMPESDRDAPPKRAAAAERPGRKARGLHRGG